jgi:pyruvate dehydrogenase E2 component (dihydrolipoamide acetyltransferase)
MPALSPTMESGTLVKWLKREGDVIAEGDILAEVETDKAVMELASFFSGTLLKRVIPEGGKVAVEGLVAILGKPGEDISAISDGPAPAAPAPAAPAPAAPAPAAAPEPAAAPAAVPEPTPSADGRKRSSPLARKIAQAAGLDLSGVAGSGPGGRVIRRDVEEAIAAASSAPQAAAAPAALPAGLPAFFAPPPATWPEDVAPEPLSGMRRTIATRLGQSWVHAPHFFLEVSVEVDALLAFREQLNVTLARRSKDAPKVSVNDFIIKACALALQDHPDVNAAFADDGIRRFEGSHVGVAVAIPDGLVVPVVRDAQDKRLSAIAAEAKSLAARARDRRLSPAEMSGATFSISNLGMFGIERFTAIINPPAACILAVGAARKVAVVREDDTIGVARLMQLTLSCDHRAVDGATGAQFLATLKAYLQDPLLLVA